MLSVAAGRLHRTWCDICNCWCLGSNQRPIRNSADADNNNTQHARNTLDICEHGTTETARLALLHPDNKQRSCRALHVEALVAHACLAAIAHDIPCFS
jgi:hypothetical protein